jgi:hypothetical protein
MNGNAMTVQEVKDALAMVHGASSKGVEDGTRVHVYYKAFGQASATAIAEAKRAEDLELPRDRYTGRVSKVWQAADGDVLVTLSVELERDHKYRTLNVNRGTFHKFVVLGN